MLLRQIASTREERLMSDDDRKDDELENETPQEAGDERSDSVTR